MIRLLCAGLLAATSLAAPAKAETKLLRDPAVSEYNLAFVYAGDIWIANRDGSAPRRLTTHPASESNPVFSADGSMIAFTASYDGNDDVFVVPAAGGQPKRLTWHPGTDRVIGFTPDGSAVYIMSPRERRAGREGQLFKVPITGGLPEKVSEIRTVAGSWDETGRIYASVPYRSGNSVLTGGVNGWRGHRGGTTPSIELIDFAGDKVTEIPGERTSEFDPTWIDGQLYFLSDRWEKRSNIFRYDPASGEVTQLTRETEWDIRDITGRGGQIVYEAGGVFKTLDIASGAVSDLPITLAADLPMRHPQWKNVSGQIESVSLSPTAKRVAVTARGEVFTVPLDKGSIRNISSSPAKREYSATWSHDGKKIAYVEDDGSEQELVIEDQSGIEKPRRIALGSDFNQLTDWGGDGKYMLFSTNRLELKALDVASGQSWTIATSPRRNGDFDAAISPEGRWAVFTKRGVNYNASLWLYDLTTRKAYAVTEQFADVGNPAFSKDGKLVYFTASTNAGPSHNGLDMSTQQQPYRAGVYAVILEKDGKSPVALEFGDEGEDADVETDDSGEDKDAKKDGAVAVDPTDISRRIVALPMSEEYYSDLETGADGALYFVRMVQPGASVPGPEDSTQQRAALGRYDPEERTASDLMSGVTAMEMDAEGETLLVRKFDGSFLSGAAGESFDAEPVSMSGLRMMIDPQVEWRQIFNDVARMEKAYFYDPNMHGLDWDAVVRKFEPMLPYVGRREDLNELMVEMTGEMGVGHNYVGGGDVYDGSTSKPGLLGADVAVRNGRYRIERIFDGEKWNPFLDAPLADPGVNAREGQYILAIDGQALNADDNIFAALSGSAGRQVTLTLADDASGTNRRNVVVEPVSSEGELRLWDWVEGNRRKVDKATGGKVAYVYMPNTGGAGFTFFNRMYFSQSDKQALILDERSNGGGQVANYVIDVLSRPYIAGWKDREGLVWSSPGNAIHGPKAMIIDQNAGSGGDFMPYAFRRAGLGPLIGTRTWGGLIGISANPGLIDGGFLSVPFFRFFTPEGEWRIENEGVAPDIKVTLDQLALDKGRDTQLEAAISVVTEALKNAPQRDPNWAPAYPTEIGG